MISLEGGCLEDIFRNRNIWRVQLLTSIRDITSFDLGQTYLVATYYILTSNITDDASVVKTEQANQKYLQCIINQVSLPLCFTLNMLKWQQN